MVSRRRVAHSRLSLVALYLPRFPEKTLLQADQLIAVGAIGQPSLWYRWLPILLGIFLTGLFVGLGVVTGIARYHVVVVVAFVGGPAAAFLSLPGNLENIGLPCVLVGMTLLA